MGREALEDILYRAQLELYSQPLLVRATTPRVSQNQVGTGFRGLIFCTIHFTTVLVNEKISSFTTTSFACFTL